MSRWLSRSPLFLPVLNLVPRPVIRGIPDIMVCLISYFIILHVYYTILYYSIVYMYACICISLCCIILWGPPKCQELHFEVLACAIRFPGNVDSPGGFWAMLLEDDQDRAVGDLPGKPVDINSM